MSSPSAKVDGAGIVNLLPPEGFVLTCEVSLSHACRRDDPLSATHVAKPRHEHSQTPDRLVCDPCLWALHLRAEGACFTCGKKFQPAAAGFIVEEL